jgi:SRSO17 transposase
MGCAGRVANGINTVDLSYVRERTGHALIGARQWIPAGQIDDPVRSQAAGLPADLRFRTKGQLAVDVLTDAYADGLCLDFVCGDEVYGSCTELRQYLEQQGQAYVLRVASSFMLTFAGARMTCADAVRKLLKDNKQWEVRSAGKGSKGERWYAWAWIATASARRSLLVRRHLGTGELAFHYCFVPEGQAASKARLITAAGLRWPVEEGFEFAKDYFGLDQCQGRLHTAIRRHLVLVMAALAICAVTAAQLRHSTATQTPAPVTPDQAPPADPGLIPLSVHEIQRLLAAALNHPRPPGRAARWLEFRCRHQARSRWFHQRTRLARTYALVS